MFSSADFRKSPKLTVLVPLSKPEGTVLSPHVVSLWKDDKKPSGIPKKQNQTHLFAEKTGEKTLRFFTPETQQPDDTELWNAIMSKTPQNSPSLISASEQIQKAKAMREEYSSRLLQETPKRGFWERFWG